ncbi:MAG: hypothetical protein K0Q49_2590 [Haloplasmataceae bacterium]|jgi:uncharacterized protein YwqG|nr:hypothetical protein [Haloplasmataceae bacterium]
MGFFKNLFNIKDVIKKELQKSIIEEDDYVIDDKVDHDFAKELTDAGLKIYINELFKLASKSIYFNIDKNKDEVKIGSTKIGGSPDVYDGFKWPSWKGLYLGFLAQINLSEVSKYDHKNQLPSQGMLYFFYECEEMPWPEEPEDVDSFKVIYYDGDLSYLKRIDYPTELNKEHSVFNEVCVDLSNRWSLPENIDFIAEIYSDLYFKYISGQDGKQTCLLGYPMSIQDDVTYDIILNTRQVYGANTIEEKDEWILLFQLDSMEEANMMWGDCGILYFMIKKEDLKNRNFDKVWMILQCY